MFDKYYHYYLIYFYYLLIYFSSAMHGVCRKTVVQLSQLSQQCPKTPISRPHCKENSKSKQWRTAIPIALIFSQLQTPIFGLMKL